MDWFSAIATLVAILAVYAILRFGGYLALGWFVRKCANRTTWRGEYDANGQKVMVPDPLFWYFQPENTTANLQRMGNNAKAAAGTSGTAASGSEIEYVTHAVPGMILDRSNLDKKEWHFRKPTAGEVESNRAQRKGWIYRLYGARTLGIFMELRVVKIREIHVSIDENELRAYQKKKAEWLKNGMVGESPVGPSYEEQVRIYETLFPYYTREHDTSVIGAETAGTFTIDIYTQSVYFEEYPVRARIGVSDPNARLSAFIQQSVEGQTQAHSTEYYLQENAPNEVASVPPKPLPSLKDRRTDFRTTVMTEVGDDALKIIGICLENFTVYAFDMDAEQRKLFELNEKTKREQQARITASELEKKVAENQKQVTITNAEAEAEAIRIRAKAEGEAVALVEREIDHLTHADTIREARAYEANKTVTHYTKVAGKKKTSLLVGGQ